MLELKEDRNSYVAAFSRLEKESFARGPSWLLPIRKGAMARFGQLGFPTTRDEEWRYTNVAPIAKGDFKLPNGDFREVSAAQLEALSLPNHRDCRLVFVNGGYAAGLSSLEPLPDGVIVGSLAAGEHAASDRVRRHLARLASYQTQAFTALNTAFMTDGAFVYIPEGTVVETPLHLLFVTTAAENPTMCHPRILIVAEDRSQAAVVESYVSLGDGGYFTNAVTEAVVGADAVLDHCKLQRESDRAYHVATMQIQQARGSRVSSHSLAFGGTLVRNDINAVLDDEGCDCILNGLSVLGGRQHVDNHLRVEHARAHCNSRETFKGVYDDESRGVFTGRIVVHKDAQKTDAKQTNMNLLLSEDARVDTKPQLEIFADDVKCTHGATIGQLDKDAVFYLRSRGLSAEAARSLLIYAFARESIREIRIDGLGRELEAILLARLRQGHLLREGV